MRGFREVFGHPPAGTWAAPGRVNLIGEHVDHSGGLCLPLPLRLRTRVGAAPRDDQRLRLRSLHVPGGWDGPLADVGPGMPAAWAGYAAGVAWALREAGHDVRGMDLLVGPTVPPGAGLASSAALGCAVALAIDALSGLGLAGSDAGRASLAAAAQRAENEVVGAPTGGMDQSAALRTRPGCALLLDCRDGGVEHIPVPGLALLVIDTRVAHRLADGAYRERRESLERAAAVIGPLRDATLRDTERLPEPLRRRARHVITEIERVRAVAVLLRAGRVAGIGPLLDASHASLRDDLEVSCAELDLAVHAARRAGALGARLTGGGFGGCAIALVPPGTARAVGTAVRTAFARAGFHPPGERLLSL